MRVAGSLVVQAYMTPSACALQRFPTWMWRNKTVVAFLDWLHGRNTRLPQEEQRLKSVGFYGLQLLPYAPAHTVKTAAFPSTSQSVFLRMIRHFCWIYACVRADVNETHVQWPAAWLSHASGHIPENVQDGSSRAQTHHHT